MFTGRPHQQAVSSSAGSVFATIPPSFVDSKVQLEAARKVSHCSRGETNSWEGKKMKGKKENGKGA